MLPHGWFLSVQAQENFLTKTLIANVVYQLTVFALIYCPLDWVPGDGLSVALDTFLSAAAVLQMTPYSIWIE